MAAVSMLQEKDLNLGKAQKQTEPHERTACPDTRRLTLEKKFIRAFKSLCLVLCFSTATDEHHGWSKSFSYNIDREITILMEAPSMLQKRLKFEKTVQKKNTSP